MSLNHFERMTRARALLITVLTAVLSTFALLSASCTNLLLDLPVDSAPQPIADIHASQSHLFRYTPADASKLTHVCIAGDFNGWSTNADAMDRVGDSFEARLTLSEGVHFYKFVADGQWINDPQSQTDLEVADNYGGKNSAVLIGLDARELAVPAADHINASAIAFDEKDIRDFNIVSNEMLRILIRTQADDVMDASVLLKTPDGKWSETPLVKCETRVGFDRFGGVVNSPALSGSKLQYLFKLSKSNSVLYVAGVKAYSSQSAAEPACYVATFKSTFETPDWAKHAVWYQIFPERFRNGDSSNDPPNTQQWTSKWFDKHPGETVVFYNDVWSRRYGGDIRGIRQELPYLRSLGVNAIYLNPIFQAVDMHKYDTSDYRHVDEHFGVKGDIEALQGETDDPSTWQWTASDKIFLDFVADAHRQGFKVIIDGVFNHVGTKFWAFQDVIKNG